MGLMNCDLKGCINGGLSDTLYMRHDDRRNLSFMTTARLLCGYNYIFDPKMSMKKHSPSLPEMEHLEDIMARKERPIPLAENI